MKAEKSYVFNILVYAKIIFGAFAESTHFTIAINPKNRNYYSRFFCY